jgi:hypothetical protein
LKKHEQVKAQARNLSEVTSRLCAKADKINMRADRQFDRLFKKVEHMQETLNLGHLKVIEDSYDRFNR